MAEFPSDVGGMKLMVDWPSPAVADTAVGGPGTVGAVNTHTAPTPAVPGGGAPSPEPPIRAVLASADKATLTPNAPSPLSPLAVSSVPSPVHVDADRVKS